MIDAAKVSKALYEQLTNSPELNADWPGIIIDRSEFVNESPDRTPWVGIYRQGKNYAPRTLGRHAASWNGQVTVMVLVQYAAYQSGEDTEDRLEKLMESVESAIVADTTIGGTLEMMNEMSVQYSYQIPDGVHNVFFQNATIEITGEVRAG